jgi:hypothetical protein
MVRNYPKKRLKQTYKMYCLLHIPQAIGNDQYNTSVNLPADLLSSTCTPLAPKFIFVICQQTIINLSGDRASKIMQLSCIFKTQIWWPRALFFSFLFDDSK